MTHSLRILMCAPLAAVLGTFASAAPASADNVTSSNWSGYAVHRSGVSFRSVTAAWRQPRAVCRRGQRSYSAFWIGLGGYSLRSDALEQIGSELDCAPSGRMVSSAWYELVPAASRTIRLRVRPGDALLADVTVTGNRVQVALADLTRRRSFSRTFTARSTDVSSAEWIAEAPSDCTSDTDCRTLPLANFRVARFTLAAAVSASGHSGSISDPAWHATRIRLSPGGRRFAVYRGSGAAAGAAIPSALSAAGSAFSVRFAYAQAAAADAQAAAISAAQLFHAALTLN